MHNPFIPGTLAKEHNFISREDALNRIQENTRKGLSSAIVGCPRVGKTSLLRRFLELEIISNELLDSKEYTLIETDFHLMMGLQPSDFWHNLLVAAMVESPHIEGDIQAMLTQEDINPIQLNQLFRKLGRQKHQIILLVDEFDAVLNLPQFNTPTFLGTLRTIAHKSDCLILITASRESLTEMNKRLASVDNNLYGASLLGYLHPIPLGSLRPADVFAWLEQHFDASEIEQIKYLSGNHPYLLQVAGALAFEAKAEGMITFTTLYPAFVKQVATLFESMWDNLNPRAQRALICLALTQAEQQIEAEILLSRNTIDAYLPSYSLEVKDMAQWGILEVDKAKVGNTNNGNALNSVYKIASMAFLLWLLENKGIGPQSGNDVGAFEAWLLDKKYKVDESAKGEEVAWLQQIWREIDTAFIERVREGFLV